MNPIESIPSKQPHFTMEQHELILNNHKAVGRHQEYNWIHRPWTPEAKLTSWDSTTRPPIECIFGAKKFWFHSCGGQHIYISFCVTVCHCVSLCHHLSLCIMFRLCLDDIYFKILRLFKNFLLLPLISLVHSLSVFSVF